MSTTVHAFARRACPAVALALLALRPAIAHAQGTTRPAQLPASSIALVADNFFGFQAGGTLHATVGGRAVQGYATVFTGQFLGRGNGQNPWTEVGVGLPVVRGHWTVTPRLGAVFGQLLSQGGSDGEARIGEGVVPSVTWTRTGRVVSDGFVAFYASARRQDGRADFLHWNASAGVQAASAIQVGGMVEQLNATRGAGAGAVFRWVGPWVQLQTAGGATVRLGAGWDTADGAPEFYKLSLGIPLP